MRHASPSNYADHGLLLLRLAFGFRLIYGTQDNIFRWAQMMEFSSFLELNGFPFPTVSAVVSVYLQFISGIAWIIGFRVRLFSLIMVANFTIALLMVHIGDTYLGAAPAIHLLVISFFLMFQGAGKFSVDKT